MKVKFIAALSAMACLSANVQASGVKVGYGQIYGDYERKEIKLSYDIDVSESFSVGVGFATSKFEDKQHYEYHSSVGNNPQVIGHLAKTNKLETSRVFFMPQYNLNVSNNIGLYGKMGVVYTGNESSSKFSTVIYNSTKQNRTSSISDKSYSVGFGFGLGAEYVAFRYSGRDKSPLISLYVDVDVTDNGNFKSYSSEYSIKNEKLGYETSSLIGFKIHV